MNMPDLNSTARRGARWVTLPGQLTTSARRFETEGFAARYFTMALIMAAWASDADEVLRHPDRLYPPNPSGALDLESVLDESAPLPNTGQSDDSPSSSPDAKSGRRPNPESD